MLPALLLFYQSTAMGVFLRIFKEIQRLLNTKLCQGVIQLISTVSLWNFPIFFGQLVIIPFQIESKCVNIQTVVSTVEEQLTKDSLSTQRNEGFVAATAPNMVYTKVAK